MGLGKRPRRPGGLPQRSLRRNGRRGSDRRVVLSHLAAGPRRVAHRESPVLGHPALLAPQSGGRQVTIRSSISQRAVVAGRLRYPGLRRLPAARLPAQLFLDATHVRSRGYAVACRAGCFDAQSGAVRAHLPGTHRPHPANFDRRHNGPSLRGHISIQWTGLGRRNISDAIHRGSRTARILSAASHAKPVSFGECRRRPPGPHDVHR